jgi:Xaa-Pro aminopeptidase
MPNDSTRDALRHHRLRAGLKDAGLDAVVAVSASDVLLLTGYWPIFSTSVAVFTAEGDCHAIVPDDEQELAEKTAGAELTLYKPGAKDKLTGPLQELREPLCRLLDRLGLQHATLGLSLQIGEQPAPYAVITDFRSSFQDLLAELLPDATLVSADLLLERQKAVKTSRELERMRKAMRVAQAGYAAARHAIEPGLREAEVASRIQAAFDSSTAALEFERSYGFFFCMSGPNSATAAAAYARTRQRRLEAGDLVMIHANTCGDGFWTDITRTYTCGEPSPRHNEMRSAIAQATQAAFEVIRPGAQALDVDAAARQVMASCGLGDAFLHGTGHGVGYAAASANALPRIHPHSPDVLESGMTFNVEPAAYFEGYGGMRHCDVVAVTEAGVELLTNF